METVRNWSSEIYQTDDKHLLRILDAVLPKRSSVKEIKTHNKKFKVNIPVS